MGKTKYLFVGSQGSGKTALILALQGEYDQNTKLVPTQGMTSYGKYIDLPGNYFDDPACYPILSVCSQQAELVVLVIGADQPSTVLPEGFVNLFVRPVVGVITKIDVAKADCQRAESILKCAGIKPPINRVSVQTGEGIDVFRQYLEKQLKSE